MPLTAKVPLVTNVTNILNPTFNPWTGTEFENYIIADPKVKGLAGEDYVESYLKRLGLEVKSPVNTGHDRIVDKYKIEIKFSMAGRDIKKSRIKYDGFMMNHVSAGKDWDRLIFMGINPNEQIRTFWFSKEVFVDTLRNNKNFFVPQQGGNKGGNDDYISAGDKLLALDASEYVKELSDW